MLISTSDVRTWTALPDGDRTPNDKIEFVIDAIQDFCESYTGRQLEGQRYYTDPQFSYLDGTGETAIYVPVFPVSYVSEVCVDADRDFDSSTRIDIDDIFYYPDGQVVSEGGYFVSGRRNVRIDYKAGYAPIVGGTHDNAVSTYPLPYDLRQVMIEMTTESIKEGITAIHTVRGGVEHGDRIMQMLTRNSMWRITLDKYKDYSGSLRGND